MPRVKNEKELANLGLKIDPNDPTQAVPLKSLTMRDFDSPPDPLWTIDQLSEYERHHHEQFVILGKRKAAHLYRLGEALIIAKEKCVHGEWGKYLKNVGISEATACRARARVRRTARRSACRTSHSGSWWNRWG